MCENINNMLRRLSSSVFLYLGVEAEGGGVQSDGVRGLELVK